MLIVPVSCQGSSNLGLSLKLSRCRNRKTSKNIEKLDRTSKFCHHMSSSIRIWIGRVYPIYPFQSFQMWFQDLKDPQRLLKLSSFEQSDCLTLSSAFLLATGGVESHSPSQPPYRCGICPDLIENPAAASKIQQMLLTSSHSMHSTYHSPKVSSCMYVNWRQLNTMDTRQHQGNLQRIRQCAHVLHICIAYVHVHTAITQAP